MGNSPGLIDKIVYEGSRVSMALRSVKLSNGKQIQREVVLHPGAVIILPILADGRIVLIENVRHTVGESLLELPAGTLEKGESPDVCAGRELEEETGYRAAKIESLGWFYTSPGILTEKMYAFVACELTPGPQALEENETISVRPMPVKEVVKLIQSNSIVDGKTIAVILKYLSRSGNR
ncbi:MAG: NUDIX hydrolase [Phycisphaerae bacterium]